MTSLKRKRSKSKSKQELDEWGFPVETSSIKDAFTPPDNAKCFTGKAEFGTVCFVDCSLDEWNLFKKPLSCGSFGCVFEPFDSSTLDQVKAAFGRSDLVLKLYDTQDSMSEAMKKLMPSRVFNEQLKEFAFSKRMSDEDIGPKLYGDVNIRCTDLRTKRIFRGFVMERFDLTLGEFMEDYQIKLPKKIYDNALATILKLTKAKLKKMHKLGFLHKDLHYNNVMFKWDQQKKQVNDACLIDFGFVDIVRSEHHAKNELEQFVKLFDEEVEDEEEEE